MLHSEEMETSDQLLPGVSLESVVEKASELERVLRSCKNVAVNETKSTTRQLEGRDPIHEESFEVSHRPSPSPHAQPRGGEDAGLTAQWHRLSTYIVGLEKEVQYYKQLVEEGHRQTEAARTGRGARSTEQEPTCTSTAEKRNDILSRRAGGQSETLGEVRGSLQPTPQQSPPDPGRGGSREKVTVFSADDNFWGKLLEGLSTPTALLPSSELILCFLPQETESAGVYCASSRT